MHGREGEDRKRSRHMWSVATRGSTSVAAGSPKSTTNSFFKDGRKIRVGDCALFKPPQDSPPFIGVIRWLTANKENNLKLGVNWLYRPAEVKLGKGVPLEAVPNEVFYSFHKDEIPAASLLHPCKVAFLPKADELPSGISSFVCRRVYDIANKCLWWLTDQDYIDERQEEVDQLLYKTRIEMHATVQPSGRSPKPMNGPTSTSQLKSGSDSVQNSTSSFPSQVKGKRKERVELGSEPIKRERSSKTDDMDSGHFRPESILKSEIAKITEKGGLVDFEAVDKLVQLMLPEKVEKKVDLVGRSMLAGVIAATDKFDCLSRFVQLRGLPVLDEWLQDVHKGKIGGGSSPKDSDKSVEEFLLVLLSALDKLPVNLQALQMCNIGKSVNHLRTHKNLEIQKKARSLVDTWKKRVEAEMISIDAKSGSNQAVSWSARQRLPEVSQGGNKLLGGSEIAMKSSVTQLSASKTASVKHVQGEITAKSASASLGSMKSTPSPASVGTNSKDGQPRTSAGGGSSDLPPTTARDEKSSSSSQSHNNSQSCSSEHTKAVGFSGKEDARSSTAGSMSVNKISGGALRHRKSISGLSGPTVSGVQRDSGSSRSSSLHRNVASEKLSQSGLTCEKALDVPIADGNGHKLIVKIPKRGRSPAQSTSGGSFEDPSIMSSRASSPVLSEKNDQFDRNLKDRANINPDVNTESWQSNDFKDVLTGSDEGDGSPAAVPDEERCRAGTDTRKMAEVSKAASSSSGNELKSGKLQDASFSSINALIESCAKYSEANAPISVGDDVGMNLLASVAAGEMSKSDLVSPADSPNIPVVEDSCTGNVSKSKSSCEDDLAQGQIQSNDRTEDDIEKQGVINVTSSTKVGDSKISSLSEEKPAGEHNEVCNSSSMDLQQTAHSCVESRGKSDEILVVASVAVSPAITLEKAADGEGGKQLQEKKAVVSGENAVGIPEKSKASGSLLAKDRVNDVESEKEVVEGLSSYPALETDGEKQNHVNERVNNGVQTEQKSSALMHSDLVKGMDEEVLLPSGSSKDLVPEKVDEIKAEKDDEMDSRSHSNQTEKKRIKWEFNAPPTLENRVVSGGLGSATTDIKSECMAENLESKAENLESKEVLEHRSGGGAAPHKLSPAFPTQEIELSVRPRGSKLIGIEADETEECASTTADASSFSAVGRPDMDAKLEFDLNEGFNTDEGKYGEPSNMTAPACSAAAHLINPLLLPVSSVSSGLTSITVAAAAKGPFVPPEDLLRSKGELGWKGSAATSAFRPAEPRKVLEMPLNTTNIPRPDSTSNAQSRPLLDFDLNVPDDRILEDMASRNSAQEMGSTSDPINNCNMARNELMGAAPIRPSGGLDLDLNQVDEASDMGQYSTSNSRRLEVPFLPVKSSSSGGLPNGEMSVRRDFDLNDGPVLDEVSAEPSPFSQHARIGMPSQPPVASLRMNNTEIGNFPSWFPPGNSFPAVTIPSILPDRGEQPFPIAPTGGPQRILGGPTGGTPFGSDVYRGQVLSSSPAVPFPSASFQYPVFPFGNSFSLPSATLSGGPTTFMDSSSGGRLCFPTVHSQLLGPAGTITSNYPRPYVVGLSDGSNSGGVESSRKWGGRQGLDLNAGPAGPDIEGRDETSSLAPRQLSVASSQAQVEEQARMYQGGVGVLKRKEPDGGWDTEKIERFGYKQSSWQ